MIPFFRHRPPFSSTTGVIALLFIVLASIDCLPPRVALTSSLQLRAFATKSGQRLNTVLQIHHCGRLPSIDFAAACRHLPINLLINQTATSIRILVNHVITINLEPHVSSGGKTTRQLLHHTQQICDFSTASHLHTRSNAPPHGRLCNARLKNEGFAITTHVTMAEKAMQRREGQSYNRHITQQGSWSPQGSHPIP